MEFMNNKIKLDSSNIKILICIKVELFKQTLKLVITIWNAVKLLKWSTLTISAPLNMLPLPILELLNTIHKSRVRNLLIKRRTILYSLQANKMELRKSYQLLILVLEDKKANTKIILPLLEIITAISSLKIQPHLLLLLLKEKNYKEFHLPLPPLQLLKWKDHKISNIKLLKIPRFLSKATLKLLNL